LIFYLLCLMALIGTDHFCKTFHINMFAAKNIFTFKKISGGGNAQPITYAIIGGGGNGGTGLNEIPYGYVAGGGGGGGQVLSGTFSPLVITTYPIVVCPNGYSGTRSATSAFSLTAITGGNGGKIGASINGGSGAHGGGGSFTYGSGNPYPASYFGNGGTSTIGGYSGGQGSPYANGGGGGGGAGSVGGNANGVTSPYIAGTGGNGVSLTIAGSSVTFSAGGGGGTAGLVGRRGIGGSSSLGGNGGYASSTSPYTPVAGVDGVIDTGSGGGGAPYNATAGNGSNGVVYIWYLGSSRASASGTGATTITQNGYTLHKFTSDGSIYFTS
jgi:hypothetical protein